MPHTDVKILIVDDLPEKQLVYRSILQEPGVEIVEARSGEEALKRLLGDEFAVILLDVNMPGMDGFETAELIRRRKRCAHMPIIFVTAHSDEMHALRGYSYGAVDYILAPVVPDILRTKIRVFVDLFRLNKQVRAQAQIQIDQARGEQARLAAVLENAADFVAQFDPAGRILHINAAGRRMLGLSPSDPMPADLAAIQPEGSLRQITRAGFVSAQSDGVWMGEGALSGGAGTEIPVAQVILAHKDSSGAVTSFSCIASDISDRKRAEAALAESERLFRQGEERLRLATRAASLGIWIWDVDEDAASWENDEPYEIFGVPRGSPPIPGPRFRSEFVHPDDLESFEGSIENSLAAGAPFYFLGRFRRTDGEVRWMELTGLLQGTGTGGGPRMIGTVADVTERQLATERARKSSEANAKFRTMFEQAARYASLLSRDGTVIESNRLSLEASGFSREQVLGRPFWKCGWWSPAQATADLVREGVRLAARGETYESETSYFLADGSERFVHLTLAPVTDERGDLLYIAATGVDITQRIQAERALLQAQAESERQRRVYEAILTNTPDFAYVFDLNHRFSYVNEGLLKMYGRTREETIGRPLVELGYPKWIADLHAQEIDQVAATKLPVRGEVPFTGAYGTRIYDYIFVPIVGPDGSVEAVAGTTRDITERKEAETIHRESERRLRAMFGQAAVGMSLVSRDGKFLQANERTAQILGRRTQDLAWESLAHPEGLPNCRSLIAHVASGDLPECSMELRMRRPEGTWTWVNITASPLLDEDGRARRLMFVLEDINARKLAEQEVQHHRVHLEQLVRDRTRELQATHERLRLTDRLASIGTLAAGLGHDMGNLLLPVRMRIESLEAIPLPADSREDVRAIAGACEYLKRLSQGLRMFALNPEEQGGSGESSDLVLWWDEVAPFFRNVLPREVTLDRDFAADLPPISMPPHMLTQAVYNLIQNAADALRGRPDGRIVLSAHPAADNGSIELCVIDNGAGMNEETRRRCIEPFFTTKTRGISTGFGLALVSGCVQRVGGTLEIESTEGVGTTFRMVIPALVSPSGSASEGSQISQACVDLADPRTSAYVTTLLTSLGVRVLPGPCTPDSSARLAVIAASADRTMHLAPFLASDSRRTVVLVGDMAVDIDHERVQRLPASPAAAELRDALMTAVRFGGAVLGSTP